MTTLFRLANENEDWSQAAYYFGARDSETLVIFFDLSKYVDDASCLDVHCFRSTANAGATSAAEIGLTAGYSRVLTPCGTVTCNHCRQRVAFDEHSTLVAIREMDTGGEPLHGGGLTCDGCFQRHFANIVGGYTGHVRYHVFRLFAKDAALVRVPVAKRLRDRETAGATPMPRVPVLAS